MTHLSQAAPACDRCESAIVVDVHVYPESALRERSRMFGALANAFPVRFRPLVASAETRTPLIAFESHGEQAPGGSEKRFVFKVGAHPSEPAVAQVVQFGDAQLLDKRLRRRSLGHRGGVASAIPTQDGDEVLASVGGVAVWVKRQESERATDIAAYPLEEITGGDVLRDHLAPGRFLGLLPLVHFLREVCVSEMWEANPPRASFIVDDPNLHWSSYGHLNYSTLVRHAREHGHHTSIAMVPLDGRYAHRRTVSLFRESRDVLSLSVHGNDHRMHELGRVGTLVDARRVVAQALRRTDSFERRTGLEVSRVMVPPYEACSPASMHAMLEVGFEAVSVTRPCPWTPLGPPHSPYAGPEADPLSGWTVANVTPEGLPVLVRRQFDEHDDVVLRAFLNQPVVLYGHVSDLADGLDRLAEAADLVNSIAPTEWCSLADLMSRSFEWRRDGGALELRPYTRRLRVRVDPDVTEIRVMPPGSGGFGHGTELSLEKAEYSADDVGSVIVLTSDRAQPTDVEIRWRPPSSVSPQAVPSPPFAPSVVLRRLLVEARDRLASIVH